MGLRSSRRLKWTPCGVLTQRALVLACLVGAAAAWWGGEAIEREVSAKDTEIAEALRRAGAAGRGPAAASHGVPASDGTAAPRAAATGETNAAGCPCDQESKGFPSAQKAELDLLRNILNEMQSEREEMARELSSRTQELDELKRRLERADGQGDPAIAALPPQPSHAPPSLVRDGLGGPVGTEGLSEEIWKITAGEEDSEGQTMWVYGTVAEGEGEAEGGGRHIVIELGSNNGQWIASFLEEKRASGIGDLLSLLRSHFLLSDTLPPAE